MIHANEARSIAASSKVMGEIEDKIRKAAEAGQYSEIVQVEDRISACTVIDLLRKRGFRAENINPSSGMSSLFSRHKGWVSVAISWGWSE